LLPVGTLNPALLFRRTPTMRAEAQAYADQIKQALDLLRRFL
jgi:hypothetical protein